MRIWSGKETIGINHDGRSLFFGKYKLRPILL